MRGFLVSWASVLATCGPLAGLLACGQTVVTANPDSGTLRLAEAGTGDAADAARDEGDGGGWPDALPGLDVLPGFDAQPGRDAVAPDAAAPDAGGALACHVDRFSSCADPDEAVRTNNEPSDSFYQQSFSVGCASSDNFVPGLLRIDSRICHSEPADWFEVTYVPCETLTMRVRVDLIIDTPCEPGAFALQVSNRPCDGSNPDVRCTQVGNTYSVEFLLPPSNSVGSIDFGVIRVSDDVAADYLLTYELYR